MQPGVEPVRVAKARQVAPGPDERLLDRVARELRVPKDEASGRVQPREGRVDELRRRRHDRPASRVRRALAGPRSPRLCHDLGGRVRQGMASPSRKRFSRASRTGSRGEPGQPSARPADRAEARRATYLRILSAVPQSSIEHQRRLRFLLSSRKWNRHAAHPLTRSSGPSISSVDAAWMTGHSGRARSPSFAQLQANPPSTGTRSACVNASASSLWSRAIVRSGGGMPRAIASNSS